MQQYEGKRGRKGSPGVAHHWVGITLVSLAGKGKARHAPRERANHLPSIAERVGNAALSAFLHSCILAPAFLDSLAASSDNNHRLLEEQRRIGASPSSPALSALSVECTQISVAMLAQCASAVMSGSRLAARCSLLTVVLTCTDQLLP